MTAPIARRTWEAAAGRAATAPDRRLPCPGCAASVKGAGLSAHVHKVHLSGPADLAPGHPVHVGRDRRLRGTAGWAAVAWLGSLAGLAALDPGPLAKAAAATPIDVAAIARTSFGTAVIGGLVVLVVLALVARAGRAQVVVTHQEVVLRHRLGTGTRRVALPARVEAGSLVRRVGGGDGEGPGTVEPVHDERVGSYLRVGSGRRAITVGCARGTRERKHWAGWSPGPARRRWDVTLSPTAFVALQYALADAGSLT